MMRMEFTFDEAAVLARGYTMERVYNAIKRQSDKFELKCVEDGEVLAFTGIGSKHDYSGMLGMMIAFSKSEWFMETASSWIFYRAGRVEDVLTQALEARRWEE
ncbi:MAG: hypothetical protein LBE35_07330 [Clostridiales bacterium]|nr:hypothetical protein [Clostridiales bacterium]